MPRLVISIQLSATPRRSIIKPDRIRLIQMRGSHCELIRADALSIVIQVEVHSGIVMLSNCLECHTRLIVCDYYGCGGVTASYVVEMTYSSVDCDASRGAQWYRYAVQLSGMPQRNTVTTHIKVDRMRLMRLCGCHCKLCYSDDTVLYLSIRSHVKYPPIFLNDSTIIKLCGAYHSKLTSFSHQCNPL